MNTSDPVRYLPHVGPAYARKLENLGVVSARDLLYHLPFRYEDFSQTFPIAQARPGQTVTVRGHLESLKNHYTKTGKNLQTAVLSDQSGKINIIWFNQSYLTRTLKPGTLLSLSGIVEWFGHSLALISPQYEILSGPNESTLHTGRIIGIYPETAGISSKWLRTRLRDVLARIPLPIDPLPEEFLHRNQLMPLTEALHQVHFPDSLEMAEAAKKRLAFDELFYLQLESLRRRLQWGAKTASHRIRANESAIANFTDSLPFKLTSSQRGSLEEILNDLDQDKPMNRLLEGDVGSGKTVVAAIAAYATHLAGYRTIFMAPTEILARQHYQTLQSLLTPHGLTIGLMTSAQKAFSDDSDIVVGTHSLLFHEHTGLIGLVVVDEQHRFGVAQRSKLLSGTSSPHLLTMTATPIPRTVALTIFGDLDLSTIDQLPEGRKTVTTYVVPPHKRTDAFAWLEKQITQNSTQAFIIYPIIDPSQTESLKSVKAATSEFQTLKAEMLPRLSLGLLHGRMSAKEKDSVMHQFRQGELQVLVATPVVEVGVDIPNATIMVIEAAERFGLAQLHQLRGRVGRGREQSYCLLFTETSSQETLARLKYLTSTYSGSVLAELDLRLRGPGEIYGLRQHGFPDLKAASLSDTRLISQTKAAAAQLYKQIDRLPLLRKSLESYKISEVTPN